MYSEINGTEVYQKSINRCGRSTDVDNQFAPFLADSIHSLSKNLGSFYFGFDEKPQFLTDDLILINRLSRSILKRL